MREALDVVLSSTNAIVVDATTLHAMVVACSVLLLVLNLFVVFLGNKFFTMSLVVQGGILGGVVGWYVGNAIADSIDKHTPVVALVTAIGFTIFCAFFTCVLHHCMQFLFGLALGVQVGSVLNVLWLHTMDSPLNRANPNVLGYVVMALLGLVLGLGALFTGKKSRIPLTAWVGAYWVVQAIGTVVGNFPPTFYPFPQDAPVFVPVVVWMHAR
ncbi:hypothetical protein, variant [Aphanomyces invadans]|uniref:TM7S3/TM198-like domain-containing protein n=1 Tax=Aphanomyces invadans TaxID=157072 RepID=A0A024ULK3_9STRA|nr:hypothetical protein, variant [Aphanomyces invadans]ETW06737.1 hypothetical protein, variant [Aphanomyces invadans]|eukprot:XP_008864812.1 hypothetical protein, variant [Aphanomyces invadans]